MKKIKIDCITLLWIAFIIYAKGSLVIHLFLAILLHELGHIFACLILKVKIKSINLSLLGARIELIDRISYFQEFTIAFAGPLLGMIGYLVASNVGQESPSVMLFALISLCLSVFNLFPMHSLDGGRIVKCILYSIFSFDISERIMKIISFLTLFTFWLFSSYIMIKYTGGLSGFIFCAIFFAKCYIFNIKKRDF